MTNEQKLQIAAYRKAGKGYKQIAKELNLSANSVKSYCRRNGLSNEALEQSLPESACENCGNSIEQKKGKKKKRFCSDKCRNQWWNSHLDQVKRKAVYEYICPTCGKFVKNLMAKEPFGSRKIAEVKTSDAKLFLIKMQQDGRGSSTIKTVR